MKYEAVFGNQDLFDGASKDAVIAIKRPFISGVRSEEMYFFSSTFDAVIKVGSSFNFNNVILKTNEYAERRIIREPKRWTVEDKKAGRLPEVGCRIYVPIMFEEQNVIYSSEKVIVSISDNGGAVTRTEVASINRIKPIETPEEKAARLCNEWCKTAADIFVRHPSSSATESMGDIYKAMLSGDLPVPGKEQL